MSWVDAADPVLAQVTGLSAELADPVRLTALQLLSAEGPHTSTQLAGAMGITPARLGNHLARLRAAGLVAVEHSGRHAVYRVAAPELADVLTALARFAHARAVPVTRESPTQADVAHTCYDHVAGRLGVAVYTTLVGREALVPPDGSTDELRPGPGLDAFAALGVDIDAVDPRRKLATACLDRSHRLPHLGGALGAAVLESFTRRRLVRRGAGERGLLLTARGRRELPQLLDGFRA
ncbi:DNA-binding transcriptional ArsR family regulator [Motilibacter peucedani]|uniref:DNA-binding transcriptional ArsR family regulator n=1 Tax=Motilibacter peucedani TaxID=598650 RepID=A0A420XKK9_9ACTN|nr:metalloregulator ArsR/SmtB family transcription factor [Motilibacter peucedani]RKS68550.1 DNA-binding transcriptional ArsR family regulator [Motilibacter peucedani]